MAEVGQHSIVRTRHAFARNTSAWLCSRQMRPIESMSVEKCDCFIHDIPDTDWVLPRGRPTAVPQRSRSKHRVMVRQQRHDVVPDLA
jgi:hypothetical protein